MVVARHHRNCFLLMPVSVAGSFLEEYPWMKNILNMFFNLYSWMFNEAIQVKIWVKCRMYYSSGDSLETWTNDLSFISCFLLPLMYTVDRLEMLLQPRITQSDVWFFLFLSAFECSAVCKSLSRTCVKNTFYLTFYGAPVGGVRRIKSSSRWKKSQAERGNHSVAELWGPAGVFSLISFKVVVTESRHMSQRANISCGTMGKKQNLFILKPCLFHRDVCTVSHLQCKSHFKAHNL